MTEPIKLPPLPMPDGTAYGDNRTIKGHYFMPEKVRAFATLAIEQATADLRADLEFQTNARLKDAEDFRVKLKQERKERDEARAELARLTTLRPIASLPPNTQCLRWTQSRTGQHWMLVDKHDWHDFWTPLPPVKEADK